jgi:SAM-dependent methyltransferase
MIRSKAYSSEALRIEFNRFTDYAPHLSGQPQYGLDGLDLLLDGVFELSEPAHIALSNTEMVHYEPTPARVILALIDRADFKADDVFYDIGSGLGRVVLLATLLSKIVAKGIECDPTLHTTATVNAQAFGLSSATFIQGDARVADFSDGTIFFMFTPFKGEMFRSVMLKLRQHAEAKPMKIFSYGACTFWLAAQSWLRPVGAQPANDFTLGQFESNL